MEEEKRHLAHIEKIVAIRPIEGADNIEVAQILGWECVVQKKDNFKVGQLAIYIEVDSVMPDKPEFEFLRARKFRIKTIKLRRQISQGLLLPLTAAFQVTATFVEEGQDVTDLLGITHHDPESSLNQNQSEHIPQSKFLKFLLKYWICRKLILPFLRKKKEAWPSWVEHTDEPRLANIPYVIDKFKDGEFYVTEKLDGQSFGCFFRKQRTNILNPHLFGVVSRNIRLKSDDKSTYWKMAKKYNLKNILKTHYRETGEQLIINGEQCGPGIQKNKYKLKEHDLYVFNIIDSAKKYHYDLNEMVRFCEKYNLKMCPIINSKFKLKSTVKEMEEYSRGKSLLNNEIDREGIVVRLISQGKKVMSFKQISSTFLLKNDD